jgi:hypothetical protein
LTVTPQFADWAISRAAVDACVELMHVMADAAGGHNVDPIVNPRGRGFGVHWGDSPIGGRIAVDSGGIIGARYGHDQPGNNRLSAGVLRRDWLPKIRASSRGVRVRGAARRYLARVSGRPGFLKQLGGLATSLDEWIIALCFGAGRSGLSTCTFRDPSSSAPASRLEGFDVRRPN